MAEQQAEAQAEQPKKPRVRRQKKHHGGHHGGAWKVAYADFITTMMALFLLLWLLNSTDAQTQKALAQYFRDPGVFKVQQSNKVVNDLSLTGAENQSTSLPTKAQKAEGDKKKVVKEDDKVQIDTLTAKINQVLRTGDGRLQGYINVTRTPKGIRISAINGPDNRLFEYGTARPTRALVEFLTGIGEGLALIREAKVTIKGHTDATPLERQDGYGNFDLSVDRALATKRILRRAGVLEARFVSVEGLGDTQPAWDDPLDPLNQRVTIDVEWGESEAK